MRAAVVFFAGGSRDRMVALARALARGMESQGHQVDVVDGRRAPLAGGEDAAPAPVDGEALGQGEGFDGRLGHGGGMIHQLGQGDKVRGRQGERLGLQRVWLLPALFG